MFYKLFSTPSIYLLSHLSIYLYIYLFIYLAIFYQSIHPNHHSVQSSHGYCPLRMHHLLYYHRGCNIVITVHITTTIYNTVVSINRLNIHTGLPEPHYPMINEYADTISNLYSGDYSIHLC